MWHFHFKISDELSIGYQLLIGMCVLVNPFSNRFLSMIWQIFAILLDCEKGRGTTAYFKIGVKLAVSCLTSAFCSRFWLPGIRLVLLCVRRHPGPQPKSKVVGKRGNPRARKESMTSLPHSGQAETGRKVKWENQSDGGPDLSVPISDESSRALRWASSSPSLSYPQGRWNLSLLRRSAPWHWPRTMMDSPCGSRVTGDRIGTIRTA